MSKSSGPAALETGLSRVLEAHGLVCGAFFSADGIVGPRVGDFEKLQTKGLASALLGPYGSARATFESLDGQLLPKMWAQGQVFAFMDKVGEDLAVVVFGQGEQNAIEQYRLSKHVGQTIAAECRTTD
jgi:hypothetical protein